MNSKQFIVLVLLILNIFASKKLRKTDLPDVLVKKVAAHGIGIGYGKSACGNSAYGNDWNNGYGGNWGNGYGVGYGIGKGIGYRNENWRNGYGNGYGNGIGYGIGYGANAYGGY